MRVWGWKGEYYGTLRQAPQGGSWLYNTEENTVRGEEIITLGENSVENSKSNKPSIKEERTREIIENVRLLEEGGSNERKKAPKWLQEKEKQGK